MPALEARYQVRDFDMFFSDYARNLASAGALPVAVPYDCDPTALMQRLDGLLVTGGQDISPDAWGGAPDDAEGDIDPLRDGYELALVREAQERRVPLLGICRGMQLINVSRGGTLVPHLHGETIDHKGAPHPVDHLTHTVDVQPDSTAADVYGLRLPVNSLHHQAVDRPGEDVEITGRAPDGVPEILEVKGLPVLAVQWHPEWMPHRDPCFDWLTAQARRRSRRVNDLDEMPAPSNT